MRFVVIMALFASTAFALEQESKKISVFADVPSLLNSGYGVRANYFFSDKITAGVIYKNSKAIEDSLSYYSGNVKYTFKLTGFGANYFFNSVSSDSWYGSVNYVTVKITADSEANSIMGQTSAEDSKSGFQLKGGYQFSFAQDWLLQLGWGVGMGGKHEWRTDLMSPTGAVTEIKNGSTLDLLVGAAF